MGFFRRYRQTIIIAVILLGTLAVFSINASDPATDSFIGRAALEVVGPVQRSITWVGQKIDGVFNAYINLVNAAADNQRLSQEVARLRQEKAATEDLRLTNRRLRALLGLHQSKQWPTVAAEVVGADVTGHFRTVIINKGSNHGVGLHMPVMDMQGLVGRTVLVSPHYSKVLLLTDPNAGVDVLVQRNRSRGIVVGAGEQGLKLNYVESKNDLHAGDVLITSGVAGVFPKGLLVGSVTSVKSEGRGVFSQVKAEPAVDFRRLEEVLIILRQPRFVQKAVAEAEAKAAPAAKPARRPQAPPARKKKP